MFGRAIGGGVMDGRDELARVERCIREAEGRTMGQLAAIARLAMAGRDTGKAERLLREMHHVLGAMHRHRRAVLGASGRVSPVSETVAAGAGA